MRFLEFSLSEFGKLKRSFDEIARREIVKYRPTNLRADAEEEIFPGLLAAHWNTA